MSTRKRKIPECGHPDAPHYGKGMCRNCYRRRYERPRLQGTPEGRYLAAKYMRERLERAENGTDSVMCHHKDREHYRSGFCEECYKQRQESKRDTYNSEAGQRHYFKKTYGITLEEYKSMFYNQCGRCLICGRDGQDGINVEKSMRLHVDHDHATGEIRGLLCNDCNRGLGCFKDNPEWLSKAALYLKASNKERGQANG